MSFATGRSDPQTGRLFFRSHGDCFIHATQWWIKYWNPSYTKDGLAIVRVTVLSSPVKVFLTTLCLAPIPYENVQKGVKPKQYLEIDPKFARELDIHFGMDVLVESIGDVERGDSLVLAPLTSSDYDKLEKFSEKIDYELTERIRVVSCHHSFPIWIDNLVIPVRVVSSQPSANWVILVPSHTMVQLQRDDSVSPNSGISIMSSTSTPGQGSPSNGSPTPSASISSTLSLPPTQKTANRQWDFNSEHSKVIPRRKKSSSSNRSSNPSDSSVDTSPTDDSDPFSSSISRFANYVGNWIFSREDSEVENEDRPSKLESRREDKASFSASLDSVGFETRCFPGDQSGKSGNQIRLGKVADVLEESNPVTEQPLIETSTSPHNQIMNEIKYTVPRYTGPLYKGAGARPGAVTPDPPPMPSMSSESEPTDKTKKSNHKRFNTWHSDTDFKGHSPGFRGGQRTVVPHMCANLRVQPHPISGLCSFNSSADSPSISDSGLWCQNRLFDIFVHPSTMPEIFLYWQNFSTESILVEITPTNPLPLDPKENKPTTAPDEQTDAKQDSRSISSSEASLVSLLPGSLVVRLCFATRIRLENGELRSRIEDGCSAEDNEGSDIKCVDLSVAVGHVVMSDTIRQQLRIKTCSPVTLQHVKDEWRISYNDRPNLVLQPLKPEHKHRSVEIKNRFEEWVKAVSNLSSMGAVLVDKQVVPVYRNEDGDWVFCRVKINAVNTRRVPPRVRYLLATGQRLSLHIDSLPYSHSRSSLKPVFSRRYRDPSPSKEETVTLPAMTLLNQPKLNVHIEHFIALEQLYTEGVEYLETVFSQTGKGGALLVCGVSGAGGSGCGKTSLAKLLCKAVNGHPHHANVTLVNCTALRGLHYKKKLKVHFSEAILHQPSVILLDDLDHTTPQVSDPQEQIGEEGNASIKKTQVLLDLFELVQQQEARVVLIATAQNKQQLNSDLLQSRGVHVFEKTLEITPPTLADRKVILSSILGSKSMNVLNDQELRAVALKTEGFQPGDLVTLVDKAISLCELRTLYPQGLTPLTPSSPVKTHMSPRIHPGRTSTDGSSSDLDLSCTPPADSFMTPLSSPRKRHPKKFFDKMSHPYKMSTDSTHTLIQGESTFPVGHTFHHSPSLSQMKLGVNDFLRALRGFVPVALRGLPLHRSGTIDFSGVGGLKTVKECLKETLLWPSKYPRLFGQCPIKQRCGVLLYGAPGTGKTFLAGAVAKEFNLNFVSIKGPELLSKYIGASEQAVRDVFTRALCAKPCILFFDEFDSLAPRRGHDNTGVTDRVVNQLLTQLDGVESLQGVYVLAASSRPDLIDPALLRPGRIDRNLLCDMPTQEERKEILESLSRDMPIAPGVDLGEIASKAEGMTGADLKALLYSAQLQAAHETLTARQQSRENSLTESLDADVVTSTPDTSGRGSSIASVSTKRPLVFNFTEGGVRRSSQLSSSQESTALALQRRGSYLSLQRRRSTLTKDTASDNSLLGKKKRRGIFIKQEQLISALSQVQPSVSKQELKKYYQIYGKFTGKTKTSMENVKPTATMA